mgnify:CR=1 FL=1
MPEIPVQTPPNRKRPLFNKRINPIKTNILSKSKTIQNFIGSTPYESTETFDIRGLTFNNSGNVQIEVSCEKAGYIPQRRRFKLRQVIEQKEISTKFNLIKEE